ncbi:hypothetical protein M3J09_013608 [Ascochyta lentis]
MLQLAARQANLQQAAGLPIKQYITFFNDARMMAVPALAVIRCRGGFRGPALFAKRPSPKNLQALVQKLAL